MKKLYLIGGTMGVGKTAVSKILTEKLPNSVFLDGDWCWNAHPFVVTDETKTMVLDNISYLLNNFLNCSAYQNIVFCWVMHEQAIIDNLLSRLQLNDCRVAKISLVCNEVALKKRLLKDIANGTRTEDIVERSLARLTLYANLDTLKIDTTKKSVEEVADEIVKGFIA